MTNSPNVNLTELKRLLTQTNIAEQDSTNVIRYAMTTLDRSLVNVSDDYLKRAHNKQLKLDKHKAWRKRRKERIKNRQQREQASSDTTVLEQPDKTPSTDQTSKEKTIQERSTGQQKRIQQLSSMVAKLEQLRDIRRKKLESQGYFFPETGDAFYNQIKAAEEHNKGHDNKTPPPHPDDTWPDQPLDLNAYHFWLQGWTSVDQLKHIRQEWDCYVVDHESINTSKIPPTMVSPSPPSSHLWARYLQ
ncbi:hypothetical protein BC941DRAFT_434931 [Chlamydoabsidia padenii]|nr:hypothetical protein BC941DRAFT_434931 [Chlamydoabsidia padenii]